LSARSGLALAVFSAATFGLGTTFASLAYEGGSNPLSIVFIRTATFVFVVGLGLALLGRLQRLPRRALIGTLWMAVTLIMVSLGYQGSVAFIPVGLAALVFYSYPVLVGLIAVAARRDRVTVGKATALLAAFLGLGLALGPEFGALDWHGVGLALLAAVGMALTIVFGGEAIRGHARF
jgi:drug/metabolite transporter (DMT)-like permease